MPDDKKCIRTRKHLTEWGPKLYPAARSLAESLINKLDKIDRDSRRERPLRVAIAGRFCSGKTTIINCLLGTDALPCDTDECTANLVLLRHSRQPCAFVQTENIRRSVSIEDAWNAMRLNQQKQSRMDNPVQWIEVGLDCDFLRRMEIVDTPGYDGTKAGHHERWAAVLKAITENCDLVVLVVTKGIGKDDFELISKIHSRGLPLVCLLNKSDTYDDEELADLLEMGQDLLREHFDPVPKLFAVSALWQTADSEERDSIISVCRRYIGGGPPVNQWSDFESFLLRRAEEIALEHKLQINDDRDNACRLIYELQQLYDLSAQAQHMFVNEISALKKKMPPPLGPRYLKLAEEAAMSGKPVPWRLLANFGIFPETIAPTLDLTDLTVSLQEAMCAEVGSIIRQAIEQDKPYLLLHTDKCSTNWRERQYALKQLWATLTEDIAWGKWFMAPFISEFSYEYQLEALCERWRKNPATIMSDITPVLRALATAVDALSGL